MCDELSEAEALSRRTLGKMAIGVAGAAMLAGPARAEVTPLWTRLFEETVKITTADGRMDACLVRPDGPLMPPVITWPDIKGLRPASRTMARDLAGQGYAVLVLNPYYRSQKAPVIAPDEDFATPAVSQRIRAIAGTLTDAMTDMDAGAALDFLAANLHVDISRGAAVIGYCMGGSRVMRTAALRPDVIKVGGSFHGGGLVTKEANSPHLLLPKIKADLLVCIAQNDDEKSPDDKTVLRQACDAAAVRAEIEVYHAMHGWCAPDSNAYDAGEAARAHGRLHAHLKAVFGAEKEI